jgi:membrane protein HdeD
MSASLSTRKRRSTTATFQLKPNPVTKSALAFWFVEGMLLILLGLVAIAYPVFASVAVAVVLGWLLIASGIAGLFGTFAAEPHFHRGWSAASSLAAISMGLIAVSNPAAGVPALIVVIALWLVLDGFSSMMIALRLRLTKGRSWAWLAASAAVDGLLAIGLIVLAPAGGPSIVGDIVGIDLVLAGLLLLTTALAEGA